MASVLDIQRALIARGYDVGTSGADGVMGRATIAAIKKLQKDKGLTVDGIVGEKTRAALALAQPPVGTADAPPWLIEADRMRGLKEVKGRGSSPAILDLTDGLSDWVKKFYTSDDIPWCGLFVAHHIAASLPEEVLPGNPLSARAWEAFGVKVDPAFGAIAVFKREGGGHVGFAVGQDASAIHVLGGNQSDSVSIARMPKSRLLGYRWPKTVSLPASAILPQRKPGDLSLSVNEA